MLSPSVKPRSIFHRRSLPFSSSVLLTIWSRSPSEILIPFLPLQGRKTTEAGPGELVQYLITSEKSSSNESEPTAAKIFESSPLLLLLFLYSRKI